eukprot:TRINITY_DN26922_c0_g1_i1.p1 TRINITY_DN26922_c0_g1~~TRINITY_DN26922_c0_g1_i1.p1  ORF type:complete len:436 (+),score=29.59 TRINITY_DN26922_c0_g1_i1:92-1399(+)
MDAATPRRLTAGGAAAGVALQGVASASHSRQADIVSFASSPSRAAAPIALRPGKCPVPCTRMSSYCGRRAHRCNRKIIYWDRLTPSPKSTTLPGTTSCTTPGEPRGAPEGRGFESTPSSGAAAGHRHRLLVQPLRGLSPSPCGSAIAPWTPTVTTPAGQDPSGVGGSALPPDRVIGFRGGDHWAGEETEELGDGEEVPSEVSEVSKPDAGADAEQSRGPSQEWDRLWGAELARRSAKVAGRLLGYDVWCVPSGAAVLDTQEAAAAVLRDVQLRPACDVQTVPSRSSLPLGRSYASPRGIHVLPTPDPSPGSPVLEKCTDPTAPIGQGLWWRSASAAPPPEPPPPLRPPETPIPPWRRCASPAESDSPPVTPSRVSSVPDSAGDTRENRRWLLWNAGYALRSPSAGDPPPPPTPPAVARSGGAAQASDPIPRLRLL